MFALLRHPAFRIVAVCLAVILLFAPAYYEVAAGSNPILTLIVGVAFGIVGVIVYDLVSCDINVLFGGCGSGSGNGSGGGSGSGGNGNGNGGGSGAGAGGSGSGSGSGGNGSTPIACSTGSVTNACGIPGTGFIVNGVCNATVPPNSSCPVPTIGEAGFYADPARVRSGNTTELHWEVEDATICALTGGGLSLSLLGIVGSEDTQVITGPTTFTLTCQNGTGGPEASAQATVTTIPSYQEI